MVPVVQELASRGLRLICAGLYQNYQGKPFEPMPQLLAIASYISKELVICVVCGTRPTAASACPIRWSVWWWVPPAPTRRAAASATLQRRWR